MRLINSRGRVILEVTSASAEGIDERGFYGVLYSYTSPGIGGRVDLVGLQRKIECYKSDEPSGHLVGKLPEPTTKRIRETMKAYLYRQDGAIGAASRWCRLALHNQNPYQWEFLGIGVWCQGRNGLHLLAGGIFTLKDAEMEEIKSC